MSLLRYFNREMDYLRNSGALFARQHPQIARYLDVEGGSDPHVERLIESFAFLTGRLQQEIDSRMPDLARALLSIVYPQLERPFPATSIAELTPTAKLTKGVHIAKHTELFVPGDVPCYFRTTQDATLWPVTVRAVEIVPQDDVLLYCTNGGEAVGAFALKLTLYSPEPGFGGMDNLMIHLYGDRPWPLFEDALSHTTPFIVIRKGKELGVRIDHGIAPGGWDDPLTPPPAFADRAISFAQDFAHFSHKFSFWRLQNFKERAGHCFVEGGEVDIFIPLREGRSVHENRPDISTFRLHCVPIVNLFSRISDPIRFDRKQVFYRLVPDQRRDRTTEVYSIDRMTGTLENGGDFDLHPYFSLQHHAPTDDAVYWVAKRESAESRSLPGSDMHVSFVDLKFELQDPPLPVIYAHTTCTNRFLTNDVPPRFELQSDESLPIVSMVGLYKPSKPFYAPSSGEALWKLISQLSTHHLDFTRGIESLKVLREFMVLHGEQTHGACRIDSITNCEASSIVRRRPLKRQEAWRGFVEGLQITFTTPVPGDGLALLPLLLARQLMKIHAPIQSFVEVIGKDEHEHPWIHMSPEWGA